MISPLNRGASQSGGAAPSGNQVVALRVAIIGAVLLGLFAIVFFRLWYLQVLSGDSLAAAASQNRSRSVAITAPRGEIIDRNGAVIVRNRRAQVVELSPGSLPTLERAVANKYGQDLGDWTEQVQQKVIARYGAKKAEKFKKTPQWALDATPKPQITPLNDPELVRDYAEDGTEQELSELTQRYKKLGWLLDLPADEVRRRVIKSLYLVPYANVPLRKNGAEADVVNYIAENQEQFPGVSTSSRNVRSYPFHGAGAQLFGQVGPVPVDAEGKSTINKYDKLNTAAQVGLSGLELQYDSEIRGRDGKVKQRIDAFGNVTTEPELVQPIPGDKLQLTLDAALQAYTQDKLGGPKSDFNGGEGNPGAAIALDPRNGQILATASHPTFDPAEFVRGVTEDRYDDFIDPEGDKPLFNRVTDAGYAGGSTFKPVTAFAALDAGKSTASEVINDQGKMEISDQKFQNAGGIAAGPVDLQKAMQVSSDIYFYTMGERLNDRSREPLQSWARKLGFGEPTGIDLPGENPGTIPGVAWRKKLSDLEEKCRESKNPPIPVGVQFNVYEAARRGCGNSDMRTWSVGDNVQLAIGQGDIGMTPLQNAVLYAAIMNGGTIVRPHLAKSIQSPGGETRQTFQFKSRRKEDLASTGALDAVRAGLRAAAMEPGGTSEPVFASWPKDRYPVYGKTGTAQKTGKQDQSWYACYVPDPKKPIVVVVTVEDGGYGAETAAPIAAQILAKWFDIKDADIKAGGLLDSMILGAFKRFDPLLLLATLGLLAVSYLAIRVSSAPELASRQLIFIVIGLIVMFTVSQVDVLRMRELKYGHYGLVIVGLVLILVLGADTKGARLAIVIGPVQLQWSEFAKLLFAMAIAAELVDRGRQINEWSTTLRVLGLTAPVILLLLAEPDLGSALVYVIMLILMLSVAGVPGRHLQVLAAGGLATVALVLVVLPSVGVSVLQPYQVDRLTSFLDPSGGADGKISDEAYQQQQAMIGIGNGGRVGQGEDATQSSSGFIPENQTDFIFAVISERWGFVGAGLVLSLYALLLWRVLRVLLEARSSYEAIVVSGIIGMLSFQIFENVGMNLGIMPITGVTLPLLSYGGSSVIATLVALGLVHAVHAHARISRDPRVRLQTHT